MKQFNTFLIFFSLFIAICGIKISELSIVESSLLIDDVPEIKRYRSGVYCSENKKCIIPGTHCKNNRCICTPYYILNAAKTACIKIVTGYAKNCNESLQCSEYLLYGGTCADGRCTCASGYHYLHGLCHKSSGLGEACEKNDDCSADTDFQSISCIDKICKCSPGFYQREYRTCRRNVTENGAECLIDQDCTFNETARCNEKNKCELKYDRKVFENNEMDNVSAVSYLKSRSVESDSDPQISCDSFSDCSNLGHAGCSAGFCYCYESYSFNSQNTKCIKDLGESCNTGDAVEIKYSICQNSRWACPITRVPSMDNRECRKVTKTFNSSCLYSEQCYIFGPDSVCVNKSCVCNEKSHYVKAQKYCWINKAIGENCTINEDCYQPDFPSKLRCKESKCSCPAETHLNSAKTACIDDNPNLGSFCSADVDCQSLTNIRCLNESCVCAENHFEFSNRCVPGVGSKCNGNKDCSANNSTCDEKTCRCVENLVSPSPELCIDVADFGGTCQYDIQCSSIVKNAICAKPEVAKPDESTIIESTSTDGICGCEKGHHKSYGECRKTRVLGETCRSRGECYVSSDLDTVHCLKGICTCDFDTKQINSTFCKNDGARKYVFGIWTILVVFFSINIIA